ncbi:uncharacterized protein A4U43_C10F4310 [Asparagus officinalis]|uniref:Uncharacterized protein n=1 Tax=Asparagus officinalis TaxID=4686 RepID=A0A5P1E0V3_ASPOF|nr:uncharacterized protein A4U43_C10F4310 [Asparagus officinalis]
MHGGLREGGPAVARGGTVTGSRKHHLCNYTNRSSGGVGRQRFVVEELLGLRKARVCNGRVWTMVEAARMMTSSGSDLVEADQRRRGLSLGVVAAKKRLLLKLVAK